MLRLSWKKTRRSSRSRDVQASRGVRSTTLALGLLLAAQHLSPTVGLLYSPALAVRSCQGVVTWLGCTAHATNAGAPHQQGAELQQATVSGPAAGAAAAAAAPVAAAATAAANAAAAMAGASGALQQGCVRDSLRNRRVAATAGRAVKRGASLRLAVGADRWAGTGGAARAVRRGGGGGQAVAPAVAEQWDAPQPQPAPTCATAPFARCGSDAASASRDCATRGRAAKRRCIDAHAHRGHDSDDGETAVYAHRPWRKQRRRSSGCGGGGGGSGGGSSGGGEMRADDAAAVPRAPEAVRLPSQKAIVEQLTALSDAVPMITDAQCVRVQKDGGLSACPCLPLRRIRSGVGASLCGAAASARLNACGLPLPWQSLAPKSPPCDSSARTPSSRDARRAATVLSDAIAAGVPPNAAMYNAAITVAARASYNAAITVAAQARRLPAAHALLRDMRQRGLEPTLITYNAMLDAAAKRGLEPTLITYNAMLNAAAKRDLHTDDTTPSRCTPAPDAADALHLLADMQERRLRPDNISYATAIAACGNDGMTEDALRLLDEAHTAGLAPGTYAHNAATDALIRAERWQEALLLQEHMPTITAPVLHCAHVVVGDACAARSRQCHLPKRQQTRHNRCCIRWEDALLLQERMTQRKVPWDAATWSLRVLALHSSGDHAAVLGVLNEMEERSVTWSPRVLALHGSGDHAAVLGVLNGMEECTTWSLRVLALHGSGDHAAMLAVLNEMEESRGAPRVLGAGDHAAVLGVLNEMEEVPMWSLRALALAGSGDYATALGVLSDMEEEGMMLNSRGYGAAVSSCRHAGDWRRALSLLERRRRAGAATSAATYAQAARAATGGACCRCWSRAGSQARRHDWRRALSLLERRRLELLLLALIATRLAARALSLAADGHGALLIIPCSRYPPALTLPGDWRRALSLLERRRLAGAATSAATYAQAVHAVCAAGELDRGLGLLNEMRKAHMRARADPMERREVPGVRSADRRRTRSQAQALSTKLAKKLRDRLRKLEAEAESTPLREMFTPLLAAAGAAGQWEVACSLLRRVEAESGRAPRKEHYLCVMEEHCLCATEAARKWGEWRVVLELLEEMQERHGLTPTVACYECAVRACGAARQFHAVTELLQASAAAAEHLGKAAAVPPAVLQAALQAFIAGEQPQHSMAQGLAARLSVHCAAHTRRKQRSATICAAASITPLAPPAPPRRAARSQLDAAAALLQPPAAAAAAVLPPHAAAAAALSRFVRPSPSAFAAVVKALVREERLQCAAQLVDAARAAPWWRLRGDVVLQALPPAATAAARGDAEEELQVEGVTPAR
ncbi:hypothetical protein JKP88DRAFT_350531 [Tribonema minus]|uniref:Pentacotripeptide-repeat region of PRORP domain-containing protein n=1 Tax=Tribonema minus TaxID=303371 RepID=A0A835YQP8_9STRA|nr:hypothetical protein JKP88DRAFT_350531 [Tribonema minus]